jgi:aspartate aminotransferase
VHVFRAPLHQKSTGYLYSKKNYETGCVGQNMICFNIGRSLSWVFLMVMYITVMNVPGLEEHTIMIDSVFKDTACVAQRIGCIVLK